MNTTIDNSELINGLINVLADSITKKVMEKITEVLDKKIADTVEKAIDSYDFSEIVDSNIDEDAITRNVTDNMDLEGTVSTEVTNQIEDYDFSDIVRAEIKKMSFEVKVS